MTSITEKFFRGCKKIKDKKELEEYKEKGRKLAKRPLRDNIHLSELEFRPKKWVGESDVLVVHFDENGNQQEFVKEYIIQRNGEVYTLNKNNGSRRDLILQKDGCFQLYIKDANGKSIAIKPRQTFLQCTSYFTDYDGWKVIMQNRGKTGDAQVDHVLQNNEPNVDIQCLDLVTCTENLNRKNLDPKNKETIKKRAKSQGKPFTITIQENGKDDIVLNATSGPDGVALLEKEGISITQPMISDYLNGKGKKDYMQSKKTQQRKVIFKYTEEFLEDQKDIPGEIWRTEDEWNLAKEIRKAFENKKDGPPKAISSFGRIKTNKDKVGYGSYKLYSKEYTNTFNSVGVNRLVGLAFNDKIVKENRQGYTPENTIVRHINDNELKDVEKKYLTIEIDGVKQRVLSNNIDTMEFGSQKKNMQDMSRDMIHKAKQDQMNAFTVTPLKNDLPKFMMRTLRD